MKLPDEDSEYLAEKGYTWELVPEGSEWWLLIKSFPVNARRLNRELVDLLIRIPPQYNLAGLDMWYVDPELKVLSSGAYPQAAEVFENHVGRRWQRFSRHLPGPWRAGVDYLSTMLTFVQQELQGN